MPWAYFVALFLLFRIYLIYLILCCIVSYIPSSQPTQQLYNMSFLTLLGIFGLLFDYSPSAVNFASQWIEMALRGVWLAGNDDYQLIWNSWVKPDFFLLYDSARDRSAAINLRPDDFGWWSWLMSRLIVRPLALSACLFLLKIWPRQNRSLLNHTQICLDQWKWSKVAMRHHSTRFKKKPAITPKLFLPVNLLNLIWFWN